MNLFINAIKLHLRNNFVNQFALLNRGLSTRLIQMFFIAQDLHFTAHSKHIIHIEL